MNPPSTGQRWVGLVPGSPSTLPRFLEPRPASPGPPSKASREGKLLVARPWASALLLTWGTLRGWGSSSHWLLRHQQPSQKSVWDLRWQSRATSTPILSLCCPESGTIAGRPVVGSPDSLPRPRHPAQSSESCDCRIFKNFFVRVWVGVGWEGSVNYRPPSHQEFLSKETGACLHTTGYKDLRTQQLARAREATPRKEDTWRAKAAGSKQARDQGRVQPRGPQGPSRRAHRRFRRPGHGAPSPRETSRYPRAKGNF